MSLDSSFGSNALYRSLLTLTKVYRKLASKYVYIIVLYAFDILIYFYIQCCRGVGAAAP